MTTHQIEILFATNDYPNIWMIGYKYKDADGDGQYHVEAIHESAFIHRPLEHNINTSNIEKIIELLLVQSHPYPELVSDGTLEIINAEKLEPLKSKVKQSQEP